MPRSSLKMTVKEIAISKDKLSESWLTPLAPSLYFQALVRSRRLTPFVLHSDLAKIWLLQARSGFA